MKMKTRPIKLLLFLFIAGTFLCRPDFAWAQSQNDQSQESYVLREFDADKLTDFREQSRYQYDPLTQAEKGPFQRFLDSVGRWFRNLIGSGTAETIWDYTWRIILFAVFILFIVKIFGVEPQAIFSRDKAKKGLAYEIDEEKLDLINFDEEIQKSMQSSQWRLAIRLMYLNAIKHLDDGEFIDVRKGKTNHDYLYELSSGAARDNFSNLSFLFDYTWYGHFDASESMTEKAQGYLSAIKQGKGAGS